MAENESLRQIVGRGAKVVRELVESLTRMQSPRSDEVGEANKWVRYNEQLPLGDPRRIHTTTELAMRSMLLNPPRHRGGIQ